LLLLGACGPVRIEGLDVHFKGNHEFGDGELLKIIEPDLKRHLADPGFGELSDAAFRLEHYYHVQGFPNAQVTVHKDGDALTFAIKEGVRLHVRHIHITGNQALSDEKIKAALPTTPGTETPYSERLAERMAAAVRAIYATRGYLDTKVDPPRTQLHGEDAVDLVFTIEEGKRYVLVGYDGYTTDGLLNIRLAKYVNDPFTDTRTRDIENEILDHYLERGYPFVTAQAVPQIDRQAGTVRLTLSVQTGPQATLGKIRVSGNDRTRKGFILERADLDRGGLYRASDMRRAEERLMKTQLFRLVRVSPGTYDPVTRTVPIEVNVEETKWGELAVRGGYASLERGHVGVDVGYRNIFGGGETARVSGVLSEIGIRADGSVAVPYVFGSEVQVSGSTYYEDLQLPSFNVRSYGFVPAVSYPIHESYEFTWGMRFAFVETSSISAGVPVGDHQDFQYRAFFFTATWDRRDSVILPSDGFFLSSQTEYSGDPLETDVAYFKQTFRATSYFPIPLAEGLVFAFSFNGGVIQPVQETSEIPISLRFFAGGTNSVRGFSEATIGPKVNGKPTGGEVVITNQVEIRFPIWGGLHGAVFSDQGNVWETVGEFDIRKWRVTAGVGLRYYTPAGAIVLDFGFNPDPQEHEDLLVVHLSIGFPF
jgi:outer membrane protein insertion porin family